MIIYAMDPIVCRESYGTQRQTEYVKTPNSSTLQKLTKSERWTSVSQFFRDVFLPQGYPESVSDDYLEYQIWDTTQAFCSSITGTLATQAVLKGVGVGDEGATVLAATMTWLMKDGTGMLGRILFAWLQGVALDCDCKRWRLFADILNDSALFLDILSPVFDVYFTLIVCISGVFKSIVGVAGGATRAALTQHQACRNNMADVSAKDGSQETLVNLSGLLCSMALIPLVTGKQGLIWLLFVLFTGLHLFANYRAVRAVKMETFNQSRLHIVLQHYFFSPGKDILSPRVANSKEPVLFGLRRKFSIKLGCSFSTVVQSSKDLEALGNIFSGSKYLLNYTKKGSIYVALQKGCTQRDQLEACFHAELLEKMERNMPASSQVSHSTVLYQKLHQAYASGDHIGFLGESRKFVREEFGVFLQVAQAGGWSLSHTQLGADEWRGEWDVGGLPDKKQY